MIGKLGFNPQPKDDRDFRFKAILPLKKLPNSFSNIEKLQSVLNQGDLGSCTAHGISGCYWAALKKANIEAFQASRLFIYFEERYMMGTTDEDSGAYIRDGIKVLNAKGAPRESLWVYDVGKFRERPPQKCYDDATKHRALRYEAVNNTKKDFMNAISEGTPVVLGFYVFDSFTNIKSDGLMPYPKASEEMLGGHCVYAYAYDKKGVWCRNSWGKEWGKNGDFLMTWRFLASANVMDCWRLLMVQ